jgi:RNA polymerase sigma-70 factor, ECF subfamily
MSSAAPGPGDPRDAELRELIARGDHERATEEALRSYGPELIGWLCSILPSTADAHDAFSRMSEELWKSLRRFDGRCAVRTWCYMLARHAAFHVRSAARNQREVPLSQMPSLIGSVTHAWGTPGTEHHAQSMYAEMRGSLDEGDRTLLALRVDRNLAWRDIAIALLGDNADPAAITRKAASLRKQFERIKDRLRELAAQRQLE